MLPHLIPLELREEKLKILRDIKELVGIFILFWAILKHILFPCCSEVVGGLGRKWGMEVRVL